MNSTLNRAILIGNLSKVQELVRDGVNIHVDNNFALQLAILRYSKGEDEIVNYLISQGADIINAIDDCDDEYPKFLLKKYLKKKMLK